MKRSSSAQWRGDLKQGQGTINSESGALSNLNYSFSKRFGDTKGTNPEELIAAAHSGCFAMAFAAELEQKKLKAETIDVTAEVSLEKSGDGWAIPSVHLNVIADVPGASYSQVEQIAQSAKQHCPVSKLLKADISMDFHLSEEQSAMV
jgi:osmotically inducible protein OsmC